MAFPRFQSRCAKAFWLGLAALLPLGAGPGRLEAIEPAELALGVRTTPALTPAEQASRFRLPPGFEMQLVAAEPDINKPFNLAMDALGRLWVTTSIEYPFAAPTNQAGRDRVMIFEDFGPDGRARKVTEFAGGLNIPIGVHPFRAGRRAGEGDASGGGTHWSALVWTIPYIWLMEDLDGDGRADRRTPLHGPFDHTRDTHGNLASFRRGFDGWVYGTHGYNNDSHIVNRDGTRVDLNSGNTWRMRLDGSRFEQHTHGQVNPYGLAWDPQGNLYSSDCHSAPIYQLLADGYYPSFGKPHDGLGFAPAMMEHAHGSTAIDGAMYYADDLWPAEYHGNFFVGNVMTSRLNRDRLRFTGSSPRAEELPDFLVSEDPWFRPVDTCLGPDGAVYVADFYNRIIGHYEVPLRHPGRDRERGRIWRLVFRRPDGTVALRERALAGDLPGLVGELRSPNLPRRLLAMGELEDRFGEAAVPAIRQALREARTGPAGAEASAVEVSAMWLLQRLGALGSPGDFRLLDELGVARSSDGVVHLLRLLAERGRLLAAAGRGATAGVLPDTWWSWVAAELGRGSGGLGPRCAAEVYSMWPAFRNLRPLLEALRRVDSNDTHLVYVLRKAVRDQLLHKPTMEWVNREAWGASDFRVLADVITAVPSEGAGSFIVRNLESFRPTAAGGAPGTAPGPGIPEVLQHATRYAPASEVAPIAGFARTALGSDPSLQRRLFLGVERGFAQRGAVVPEAILDWGRELAGAIASASVPATGWVNHPLDTVRTSETPWDWEQRRRRGGGAVRMLSSLPQGEDQTGTLRSPVFEAPLQMSFLVAGHDGAPDRPAQNRNWVRLVGEDGRVLREARPPRSDEAVVVEWVLKEEVGRRVVFEITDGYRGDAYAWLAVAPLAPFPVPWPEESPAAATARWKAAADVAAAARAEPLAPRLMELARHPSLDIQARAAAARAGSVLSGRPVDRALAEVLGNDLVPASWREQLSEILPTAGVAAREAWLGEVWKRAPHRFQLALATAWAGVPERAGNLLERFERREAPLSLLQDPVLRDRLTRAVDRAGAAIPGLVSGLPAADALRQRLVEERRGAYNNAPSDPRRGREVFGQVCSACHQLEGQGGLVGPQLTGIGSRGVERLCEDILDPNRNVDVAFRQSLVVLANDEERMGLFRREDGGFLVFADATGKEFQVRAAEVRSRRELPQSLMPDNFSEAISVEDFNHLLAYLLTQRSGAGQP